MQSLPAIRVQEKRERGSTLLEVLIALLIFLILMLGVLQLFSLAFVVNEAAMARTEMTYKCQQVVENMRYLNYLYVVNPLNPGSPHTLTAIPLDPDGTATVRGYWPLVAGATHDLYNGATFNSDLTTLNKSYWGPSCANVIEYPKPRYAITMTVAASGAGSWVLTVTAKPNSLAGVNKYIGRSYNGGPPKRRIVEYVAYLPP